MAKENEVVTDDAELDSEKTFADAFDAALEADKVKDDEPKGEEATGDEPKDDEPKGEEATGDEPKGEEPKGDEPKGEEPKGDEPKGDEPKVEAPKADEPKVDWEAEYNKLKNEKPAPVVEPDTEVKQPDPPTASTVLTAEELALLTAYEEEWPDVSKAEMLRRKVDLAVMEDKIYREVAAALSSVIGTVTPAIESVKKTAQEKHVMAIAAVHKDYSQVMDEIGGWIEKQPAYLKQAMSNVISKGTTEEVIDLFTRFKTETGKVTPQVNADQSDTPSVVDEAAVQALTGVTSGRKSSVKTGVDSSDFAGAWEQAAAS